MLKHKLENTPLKHTHRILYNIATFCYLLVNSCSLYSSHPQIITSGYTANTVIDDALG